MVNVVGVKFKHAGKIYYFDPAGIDVQLGDHVIVETARGLEFGTVALEEERVDKNKIITPLKPIIRIANEEDVEANEENKRQKL